MGCVETYHCVWERMLVELSIKNTNQRPGLVTVIHDMGGPHEV